LPAYWNNSVYFWGFYDSLRQYSLGFKNGQPSLSPFATAPQSEAKSTMTFVGTTPSISANGNTNGIVWSDNWNAAPQVLYAHDAANVATTLWSSAQNSARDSAGGRQKFAVPTVADGKVFLASEHALTVYGMVPSSAVSAALRFIPIPPCRAADTRKADSAFGGPIVAAGTSRTFLISNSACGIPANAQAYALNVTVVPSGPLSALTVWPSSEAQPALSLLSSDGRVKANAAIVGAGSAGGITLYASNETQAIIDISGYFVAASDAAALAFYPVTPCRAYDTRVAGQGAPTLAASQTRNFALGGACGIPLTAQAYSLNLMAIPKTTLGFLSAWPAAQPRSVASVLNSDTGTVVANAAIVQAGENGAISVYASDATDLAIDVNGYFAAPGSGGSSLYTMAPCRAQDTRSVNGGVPFGGILDIPILGSPCTVPSDTQAYVLNATVIPAQPHMDLSLWPDGLPVPGTSTLNADDAATTSNMAIVGTTNGIVSAFASDSTELVLDISGYFAP
jgi:hypothetical protein